MKIVEQANIDSIQNAAEVLKSGGILIFPTDTVYGVGCGLNVDAIEKLYKIKNRPMNQPTAVLMSAQDIPDMLKAEFAKYPAGEVTIISNRSNYNIHFPEMLLKDDKIGVRVPNDKWLQDLLKITGPIVVSSANIAGEMTPQKYTDINPELLEQVDLIIKSDTVSVHKPSTVYDLELDKIIRA